jgi:hypothetical protein
MDPLNEPVPRDADRHDRRWRALVIFLVLLAALTVIGLALLGDRLFDLEFSP